MAITWRYAALVYRVLAVALIAFGLVRLTGLFGASGAAGTLRYFTTQSNVLAWAWLAVLVAVTVRDIARDGPRGSSAPWVRLGGTVMMAITVTMLVYLTVLAPAAFEQSSDFQPFGLTDVLVHIVAPCLIIGDWLLFAPKGRLRLIDPLLWTLIPYAYVVYVFVWSALGGTFGGRSYPYPFLDVDALGVSGVAAWIAGLSVVLVAVGYVYVGLDVLLARRAGDHAEETGREASRAAPQP